MGYYIMERDALLLILEQHISVAMVGQIYHLRNVNKNVKKMKCLIPAVTLTSLLMAVHLLFGIKIVNGAI